MVVFSFAIYTKEKIIKPFPFSIVVKIPKVFFLFALFLLLLSGRVFAGTQKASGIGATEELARKDAMTNLASQLKSRIHTSQRLYTKSISGEASSIHDEIFITDSSISTSVNLFGVKFEEPKMIGENISVIAFIDEEALPQYIEELVEIKRNIELLEQQAARINRDFGSA